MADMAKSCAVPDGFCSWQRDGIGPNLQLRCRKLFSLSLSDPCRKPGSGGFCCSDLFYPCRARQLRRRTVHRPYPAVDIQVQLGVPFWTFGGELFEHVIRTLPRDPGTNALMSTACSGLCRFAAALASEMSAVAP